MKNTFIVCCIAAMVIAGMDVSAEVERDRIHTIKLITSELPDGVFSANASELHSVDIDSISFDVDSQIFTVFGGSPVFGIKTAEYDLSLLRGFDMTFLSDGKMPSTSFLYGEVPDGMRNDFSIYWRPVEGAAGYQVRYKKSEANLDRNIDWNNIESLDGEIQVGSDETHASVRNLEYSCQYFFAIRTLAPNGDVFHSDWSVRRGSFKIPSVNNFSLVTGMRYVVPNVLSVKDKGFNEITVGLDFDFDESRYSVSDADTIKARFEIRDGRFVVDKIVVTSCNTGFRKEYLLTSADVESGMAIISGLEMNEVYDISAYNSNIASTVDAVYNTVTVRTKSLPNDPVTISGGDENFPVDISEVLSRYMTDSEIPENQTYYLEGGKSYSIKSNVTISKGFTLATHPDDVANGKRAKFYMDVINGASVNFMLGEGNIDPVVIADIDFDVDVVNNPVGSMVPNYFINAMPSLSSPANFKAIEIKGCTFQRFIRGFVRIQGTRNLKIEKFNVDGNLFYNCGYYDTSGRGYAWFASAGEVNSNIFSDFRFTNNTIYDSPRVSLINDRGANLAWGEDVKWNIRVENNTFVNFSTRTIGRFFLDLRYLPGGSYISFQRNLIALAADEADERNLYQAGADIRVVNGSGIFSFDVKDNYSVGCRDKHLADNGIFTSGAFSVTRNSFGAFPQFNNGSDEDLKVKVGSTPLKSTDLFANPNPPYVQHDPAVPNELDHSAPVDILNALKYKRTPEVMNHEIYNLNVGDPRWR